MHGLGLVLFVLLVLGLGELLPGLAVCLGCCALSGRGPP
jgi:hypothetical protein